MMAPRNADGAPERGLFEAALVAARWHGSAEEPFPASAPLLGLDDFAFEFAAPFGLELAFVFVSALAAV